MTSPARLPFAKRILASVSACLAASCAANLPYHSATSNGATCASDPDAPACLASVFQEFASHDIAFAEFTERGNAFDDKAITQVLEKIDERARNQGVIVVVFVHGWKHNAAEEDDNVRSFKASMSVLSDVLAQAFKGSTLASRRLVGLYVGWRGATIRLPWLEQLTFWDRKAVAEELGSGSVTRLLLDVDHITAGEARNVMVVIGHSFGGAIVVRALTEVLTDHVINPMADGRARALGNGVLVLNPAIEANQALPLIEAALERDFAAHQLPLFISLSSDADWATHYAFPAGQTLGLLTWRQAALERGYYHDRSSPQQPMPLQEKHLDATTAGNFAPFLTHCLSAIAADGAVQFTLRPCAEVAEQCRPRGWTTLGGLPTIGPFPDHYPLYFIKTDKSLMDGHNDIFNEQVRSFVFTVIDDVVRLALRADERKASATEPTPADGGSKPLIASPAKFSKRMGELHKQLANVPLP